jgi:hypothetical protein
MPKYMVTRPLGSLFTNEVCKSIFQLPRDDFVVEG